MNQYYMAKSPERGYVYEIPPELEELKSSLDISSVEPAPSVVAGQPLDEAEMRTRDKVHRQRVEAHRRKAMDRAAVGREGVCKLSLEEKPSTAGDELQDIKFTPEGGGEVSMKEILGAEKVTLKSSGVEKRGEVVVPSVLNTKFEKLNVVLKMITARVMTKDENDMTDNEKKIAKMYGALDAKRKALSDARACRDASFEKKAPLVLDAENAYLATLKDIPDVLLEEFQAASELVHEKSKTGGSDGVHLENVLGLEEGDVEDYVKKLIWLQSMDAISPYEETEQGYKNKATGEIENPSFLTRDGLAQRVKMYLLTTEIGKDYALRKKLGGHKAKVAARYAGNLIKSTAVIGMITGAIAGVLARTMWRTVFEAPIYYASRFLGKTADKVLKKLHVPFAGWLKTDEKSESPWKKRGDDYPFIGPVSRTWGAVATGEKWRGDKEDGKKRK